MRSTREVDAHALVERVRAGALRAQAVEHRDAERGDAVGIARAAGAPAALDASLGLVRGRGTVSVVGAHFEPDYPLNNALMFECEITLRFTVGDPGADREMLLGAIAERKLEPSRVLTYRVPLDEAPEAYRLFDEREAVKVLLEP